MTSVASTISHDPAVRQAYAGDASGIELIPDAVARPTSAAEVVALLESATATATPMTPAGGQSSTTAASITDRGMLLSLKGLDRILDLNAAERTVRVEAGVGIAHLKAAAAAHGFLFACDPTSEEEATIGGAIACNASGARSLRYGAIRRHVVGLDVVRANGEPLQLRRPRLEKNTVGYFPMQDPVDWFIGSEGTLGVVVAAELALLPLPERVTGLGISFDNEHDALAFVKAARDGMDQGTLRPRCLEFLDAQALEIVRSQEGGASWRGAAFVYIEEETAGGTEPDYDAWLALVEAHHAADSDVQVFDGDAAIRTARRLRHVVPATMHERGGRYRAAGGRRVSTDWAVPYARLEEAVSAARNAAVRHGIEMPIIYGHAGNGHPHENFIARNSAELEAVSSAITETLKLVLAMGGTVAAEHGVGKLKRHWVPLQVTPLQMRTMWALKRELDPSGLLAPGNLLS